MKGVPIVVRELREDHDLSQTQVAALLGISQQHYSLYENGRYEIPYRHLITLADYYGVSIDYLASRTAQKQGMERAVSLLRQEISADYTLDDLTSDVWSLDQAGRSAVAEYVTLQKLKRDKQQKE